MRLTIISTLMILSGCATLEQQCDEDMQLNRFNSYQECLAFRQDQQRQFGRSMSNIGNAINQQRQQQNTGQGQGLIDFNCRDNCLQAGNSLGLCTSKCSY